MATTTKRMTNIHKRIIQKKADDFVHQDEIKNAKQKPENSKERSANLNIRDHVAKNYNSGNYYQNYHNRIN